jgi:hypothetical protein
MDSKKIKSLGVSERLIGIVESEIEKAQELFNISGIWSNPICVIPLRKE